jgi:hypothetical protein
LLPLNYFSILRSRQIETLLVVHARTQAQLKALFPAIGRSSNALSNTWLHRLLNNCGRFIPARVNEFTFGLLSHLYTQVVQRRIVRRLVSNTRVMLYTNRQPVSATFPSLMFGLGAAVAMGPLNTAVKFPLAFRSRQNPTLDLFIAIAHQCVDFFNRLLVDKIKAETVLVANDRTQQALPSSVRGKIIELVEKRVDFSVWRSDSSLSKAWRGSGAGGNGRGAARHSNELGRSRGLSEFQLGYFSRTRF